MSRCPLLPLLLLLALTAACASAPSVSEAPGAVDEHEAPGVSSSDLARRHGLSESFDSRRNRLVLENAAHRVVLFPGTTVAVVDGNRVSSMQKIRVGNGGCLLEPADAQAIDQMLRRRASPPAVVPHVTTHSPPRTAPEPAASGLHSPALSVVARAVRVPLRRKWKYIIIHHSGTASGNAAAFDIYHREQNRWDGLGYHFVVGNGNGAGNGQIEVGYRWRDQLTGAHAGRAPDRSNVMNETGIGVCLVGNFDVAKPSPEQLATLTSLIAELGSYCGIPASNVLLHSDIRDTKCPGRLFPAGRFQVKNGVKSKIP